MPRRFRLHCADAEPEFHGVGAARAVRFARAGGRTRADARASEPALAG